MRPWIMRSKGLLKGISIPFLILCLGIVSIPAYGQVGLSITPPVPGVFNPEEDLRAATPLAIIANDSIAALTYRNLLYRIETEFDSSSGFWVSTRYLFNRPYGAERVFDVEGYREYRMAHDRDKQLRDKFWRELTGSHDNSGTGALEIQVPFRIRSRTLRRIFGGDRVGLRVTGRIELDGGFRRERSDQTQSVRTDQTNYNFRIDQQQQFHITGRVGDKVSVEIDQDSETLFDFENNVHLLYEGDEHEIIQTFEAGNISFSLPGTQLATLGANTGLFGFKTVARVGPLSITALASLQKGENNRLSATGGSRSQTKRIEDVNYVRNRYFFLDPFYRESYTVFDSDYLHRVPGVNVTNIRVFRSARRVSGDNNAYQQGWAFFDPSYVGNITSNDTLLTELIDQYNNDDALSTDRGAWQGMFREIYNGTDFEYDREFGYIRLNNAAMENEVIAVAYEVSTPIPGNAGNYRHYGSIDATGSHVILRLLKQISPVPEDPTWDLAWRNVYWMETTDLRREDFDMQIVRNVATGSETAGSQSWLEIFGLDNRSEDGSLVPDNKIDGVFVNYATGEVIFPDLQPFDPLGYTVNGMPVITTFPEDSLNNPDIYTVAEGSQRAINSLFKLEATYSNASASYDLGINVLEGSEEVYLNGRRLEKDIDYIIDYLSGQISIINEDALAPGADLDITYESGEIFQLDRRTMVGIRLEYALWEDSFLGATFLYFNEKPIEERVKVGQEPLRNFIWDFNARLRFRPYFMTRMVDLLPLVETDEPSELTIEGEIAQVFPDPNNLNNERTDDPAGVAYVDDFEASKRATPLSVMRKSWYPASFPYQLPVGLNDPDNYTLDDYRSRFIWYNPRNQVSITEIWPNREINSKVQNSIHVLTFELDPEVNNFRRQYNPEYTWNGVMRWLTAAYYYQEDTKYIEIWANWSGGGSNAMMFIDIGEISEDVIPNGSLDTEDVLPAGIPNGLLDDASVEDLGIDGMRIGSNDDPDWRDGGESRSNPPWYYTEQGYAGGDTLNGPYDFWDLDGNGVHTPETEPFSSDNWQAYSGGTNQYNYINGTQGSANDEIRVPDTEDLDNNNTLNQANRFFRYRFRMNNAEDSLKYIVGGQDNENGWRLIRIPKEDIFTQVGDPDFSHIKYIRVFFTGCSRFMRMEVAQIELVGNEWLETPVWDPTRQDSVIYVESSTINTHDNPEDYEQPPGVEGEIDPVTDIRSKEQSLVLQVIEMPTAGEGMLVKTLRRTQNLREYNQLKMFVHGGGRYPENMAAHDMELFLRFGSGFRGANRAYYEYSLRLQPGWEGNEIIIDLDQLTALKEVAAQSNEEVAQQVLPNGHVIRVYGEPSIGAITSWAIGLRNYGAPIRDDDNVEVWVDELRLSHVRRESGIAMRSSINAEFADFLELRGDLNQRDANFHQVNSRVGSDNSELRVQVDGTIHMEKFLDPEWGFNLPLSGSAKNSITIPKYTTSNGDIRTETIFGDQALNIWDQFGRILLNRDFYRDRLLFDDGGVAIVDTATGLPLQDLNSWGLDSLLTTEQQYTWRFSVSKSRPSPNVLLKYTLDKMTFQYDNSQSFRSNLNYQYQKTFTNHGRVGYSLSLQPADFRLFRWTENIPILNSLADTRFNYLLLNRVNASVDGTETRSNNKYRNAEPRPTYRMSLTRNYGFSLRPFNTLTVDYSNTIQAQMAREDSTVQTIVYSDLPDSTRNRYYRPTMPTEEIIDSTLTYLRSNSVDEENANALADEIEAQIAEGIDLSFVLEYLFNNLGGVGGTDEYKRPWSTVEQGNSEYDSRFWTVGNMPFTDTQRTQRISVSYSPDLFSWLSGSVNYSTTYTWAWQNWSYLGRSVSSNNSLSANTTFKLRQLLPNARGSNRRGNNRRGPGAGGFGAGERNRNRTEPDAPQSSDEEEGGLPNMNPLKGLLWFGQRIQDIRVDYTQNLNFTNPSVTEGNPTWEYMLGLTGDPGLERAYGAASPMTSNRSDDYRVRSGIDWSTRISTGFDYNIRFTAGTGNQRSGSMKRSSFHWFTEDNGPPTVFDIPNWSLRIAGLEQIGPLSNFAQSITMDHAFNGEMEEAWNDNPETNDTTGAFMGYNRVVTRRNYTRNFSPFIGFNITWKYGISTNIQYNWNENVQENPNNSSISRNTTKGMTINASYTRNSGFRIPIPIWPFKNRRFENQTTFSLQYQRNTSIRDLLQANAAEFSEADHTTNWHLQPSITYSFSRTVTGSLRYKYGLTESKLATTRYQEFGVNIVINIRG